MSALRTQVLRFLASGAVNTVLTYCLYLILLPGLGYRVAYSIAFACGIVFALLVNARYVFRARIRIATALAYPLIYVLQYGLGLLALHLAVVELGMDPRYALALSILITLPITFVLSRLAFYHGRPTSCFMPKSGSRH